MSKSLVVVVALAISAGVNPRYWEYNTGHGVFGTNEVETMTNSKYNVHMDGHGNLDLIVLGHGAAGNPKAAWTSGRVETRANRLFNAPPGGEMMVTASIKQPNVQHALGYWPGFWMLGRTAWPGTGEIDILEDVDGYSKTSGTLHCGNLTQKNPDGTFGPCHETNGLGSGLRACAGCQQSFHTYSVIIDRRTGPNRRQKKATAEVQQQRVIRDRRRARPTGVFLTTEPPID